MGVDQPSQPFFQHLQADFFWSFAMDSRSSKEKQRQPEALRDSGRIDLCDNWLAESILACRG